MKGRVNVVGSSTVNRWSIVSGVDAAKPFDDPEVRSGAWRQQ